MGSGIREGTGPNSAWQARATLVPAFGYDYVPGNLAGALALERASGRTGSRSVTSSPARATATSCATAAPCATSSP